MKDYGISTYGDRVAEVYDERVEVTGQDTEAAVAFLADVAGGAPLLELAIGTGRLALPLVGRGLEVHGVDSSEPMVERLRAKPGGAAIPVTIGDFADVPVEGEFPLVFVAFNTLFALLSQEAQLRCFRNVAAHLAPGGAFVIEVFVPDLSRFDRGQRVGALLVDVDTVELEASRHYPAEQRVESLHVRASEDGIRLYPVQIRYAWPSELDLMARLAGMRLRDRFGSWHREPFTDESERHVSVYELGA
jgi:SAM-dependent methyltransferase